MIKVLIVDDSRTARAALRAILERDSEIFVVGEATNGAEALKMIRQYDPHFITMDIYLERENGLDITRAIMAKAPRPILVITGVSPHDPELGYKAIERGALDVFPKPPGPGHAEYEAQSAKLIRLVKTLSKVPVLHQRRHSTVTVHPPLFDLQIDFDKTINSRPPDGIDLLLIGASTGGPPVVSGILERLPKPAPMPIIVVQHITKGFAAGFSEWLGSASGHRTMLVDRTVMIAPGMVYIASDDANLVFTSSKTLRSREDPELGGPRPNIDRLFISAADYSRPRTVALVLTGMGSDGAAGLAHLKRAGATVAVQDPETCVVDSMPKSAIEQGVEKKLTPDEIVQYLKRRIGPKTAVTAR